MKIVFLSDSFPPNDRGGAGIVAKRLAEALSREGHQIFVLTTVQDKSQIGRKIINGVEVCSIYSKYNTDRWRAYLSIYNPQTINQIKKYFEEIKPDVVHAHNIHTHLSYHSLKIAKDFGSKVFLTAHDVMSFNYRKLTNYEEGDYKINPWRQLADERFAYFPLRNILIRWYLKSNVRKIITVSSALKEALHQNGIDNSEVIYNGVDPEKYKQGKSLEPLIHFGGRLSAAKGAEQILKALVLIKQQIPKSKLLVLGDKGKYTKSLENLSVELGVNDCVYFGGWLSESEMAETYSNAAICVTPSICFDSFPTNNLEAMASGLPVVATIFGGSKEQVVNEKSGFIVDPRNTKVLAEKIASLLLNPKKARLMGKYGQQLIKKKFTLKMQAEKILKLYNL